MSCQQVPTSSSASFATSESSFDVTPKISIDSRTALVSPQASISEQAAGQDSQPKHGGTRQRMAAKAKGLARKVSQVFRPEKKATDSKEQFNERQAPKPISKAQPNPLPARNPQQAQRVVTERERMEVEHEKTLPRKFNRDMAFLQDAARARAASSGRLPLLHQQYYPSPHQQQQPSSRQHQPGPRQHHSSHHQRHSSRHQRHSSHRHHSPGPRQNYPNPHQGSTGRAPMLPPTDRANLRKMKRPMSRILEEDSDNDYKLRNSSGEERSHQAKGPSAPPRHHYPPPNPPRSPPPTGA